MNTRPESVQPSAHSSRSKSWAKGMVLDVAVGSDLEKAISTANLRAAAATDLVGRDGISN